MFWTQTMNWVNRKQIEWLYLHSIELRTSKFKLEYELVN